MKTISLEALANAVAKREGELLSLSAESRRLGVGCRELEVRVGSQLTGVRAIRDELLRSKDDEGTLRQP